MRMVAQPGRRQGRPSKCLYSAPLRGEEAQTVDDGSVTVTVLADDIYSKSAKQRYQITFSRSEILLLSGS